MSEEIADKTLAELVIERFVEDELQETARVFARTYAEEAANPVEIVVKAIEPIYEVDEREVALDALTALHEEGWRIVRTQPLDPGHFVDARDDNVEITEEWKP